MQAHHRKNIGVIVETIKWRFSHERAYCTPRKKKEYSYYTQQFPHACDYGDIEVTSRATLILHTLTFLPTLHIQRMKPTVIPRITIN